MAPQRTTIYHRSYSNDRDGKKNRTRNINGGYVCVSSRYNDDDYVSGGNRYSDRDGYRLRNNDGYVNTGRNENGTRSFNDGYVDVSNRVRRDDRNRKEYGIKVAAVILVTGGLMLIKTIIGRPGMNRGRSRN
jgi:hypothetical protein